MIFTIFFRLVQGDFFKIIVVQFLFSLKNFYIIFALTKSNFNPRKTLAV